MMIEADLRTYLLGVDSISDVVRDQIFGVIRPQGMRPLPELLIFRTQSTRQVKFCATDKLVNAEIQIDSYGMEGMQVLTLARAVRHALVDFVGTMGETRVDQVTLVNEFPLSDGDPGIIRMMQIYNFWYVED